MPILVNFSTMLLIEFILILFIQSDKRHRHVGYFEQNRNFYSVRKTINSILLILSLIFLIYCIAFLNVFYIIGSLVVSSCYAIVILIFYKRIHEIDDYLLVQKILEK